MYILGIACYYHDSSAALIQDGELVAASMEERFSRKKHDNGFPQQAVEFCLAQAQITSDDLDYVVFYEKPLVKFERIMQSSLNTFPRSWRTWREAMVSWFKEKLWVRNAIATNVGVDYGRILFCDHHMSHAASAFFASPFKDAAILTIDGVGEWTTTTLGKATSTWGEDGKTNEIDLFAEQRFPHSLGLLYSTFTAWLGFRVNNGEYKVMGMTPYGEPNYIDKVEKVIQRSPDGQFALNMDYFDFHHSLDRSYSNKFLREFGPARVPDADFFTMKTNPERSGEKESIERNQFYADVAASIQRVTEDIIIDIANDLHKRTGLSKLCYAGGVALNTKANWRILNETPFEEIYIQPAAGDDGGSLGAALWAYHVLFGNPRKWIMPHSYWGKAYNDDECQQFLDDNNIAYESFANREDPLLEQIVDQLTNEKVVALMQGRFEWGPRALGNRSILADPRYEHMKEVVNTKIKFREPFRPFAPVITKESAPDYFDYPAVAEHEAPRYMLMVAPIKEDKQDQIQAVNHEGTGRLQSIDSESNPLYYNIVKQFGEATGVPVVLNTSFNLRGEPIVNEPRDAFNTFTNSDIDTLVMGSFMIKKPE